MQGQKKVLEALKLELLAAGRGHWSLGKSQKGSEPPSQRSRPMILKFEVEPAVVTWGSHL